MADITQIGTLLGSPTTVSSANIYNLVTGGGQNATTTLLSSLAAQSPTGLTDIQTGAISSLQNFVQENVSGPQADKLLASIAALQKFLEFGNENAANLDPVFSLLAGNTGITGNLPNGTLIDQLL